jgi:threonine/homoserine/homoserine lactone efflux protein
MENVNIIPLIAYAFATSVTPGPNNMMLLASGANFGLRRSAAHMLGISLGHAFMVFLMGLGLAASLHQWPNVMVALKIAALVYVFWLAWKIAHSAAPSAGKAGARPLTFFQAAAFQWINPKAIAMAITAATVYGGEGGLGAALIVAAVFAGVNLPSVALWCGMGLALQSWLSSPRRLKVFNWTMACLLLASMAPVFWA